MVFPSGYANKNTSKEGKGVVGAFSSFEGDDQGAPKTGGCQTSQEQVDIEHDTDLSSLD